MICNLFCFKRLFIRQNRFSRQNSFYYEKYFVQYMSTVIYCPTVAHLHNDRLQKKKIKMSANSKNNASVGKSDSKHFAFKLMRLTWDELKHSCMSLAYAELLFLSHHRTFLLIFFFFSLTIEVDVADVFQQLLATGSFHLRADARLIRTQIFVHVV